ncbi:hypothetical protein OAR81_01915, partial [Candidatus Pelagibacter sp.]|nr:hypothetical protein [Candidatus Pelagibacter sp.]
LVTEGKIGKVKQTMGTGPHRQGNYERPNWFYERESYGGIITDIGSHQIHQFLVFTNSNEAKITHSIVENTTKKRISRFSRFWRNQSYWKWWTWIYSFRLVHSRCTSNVGRWKIIYPRRQRFH